VQHKARKRFGQNFLHDQHVINRLIAAISPSPKQHIVEIGAGMGAMTVPLLETAGQLDVVELDRDLVVFLKEKIAPLGKLTVYQADALKFDFQQLATNERPLRIVGNLPYNISTPLLFHLLNYVKVIDDMTFMLQKEVVDRLAAKPHSHSYGRLSVVMQYYCQVEKLFDVPPEAFDPQPKVDSSIVRLIPYQTPPVEIDNEQDFKALLTQAFSQRRKTLRNNLKKWIDATTIESMGIDPQARAETLTLAEFAQLANLWTKIKT